MDLMCHYGAESLYAYPSSNATDGGRNHSEYNVSNITYSIVQRNYVLRRYELSLEWINKDDYTQGARLTPGDCSIHGYKFELIKDIIFSKNTIPTMIDVSGDGHEAPTPESGIYYVIFKLGRDTEENILPDITDPVQFSAKVAECLQVHFTTQADDLHYLTDDDLYLGYIEYDADIGAVTNIYNNPRKYFITDWTMIEVHDETIVETPYMSLEEYLELFKNNLYKYMDNRYIRKDVDDYALGRIDFRNPCQFTNGLVASEIYSGKLTTKVTDFSVATDDDRFALLNDQQYFLDSEDTIQIDNHDIVLNDYDSTNPKSITFHSSDTSTSVDITAEYSGTEEPDIIRVSGDFTANRVMNAVWNDYAEFFRKADPNEYIEAGDLVSSNGVVAWKTKDPNDIMVIGVCTNSYGHILGGSNKRADNYRTHVAVAMCGQVKVKINGSVEPGDLLISDGNGYARRITERDHDEIGRCTTNFSHDYKAHNPTGSDVTEHPSDGAIGHVPHGENYHYDSTNHNSNTKSKSRFRFMQENSIQASFYHPGCVAHDPNRVYYDSADTAHYEFEPCNGECHVARIIGKYLGDDAKGNHIMQVFLD